MEKPPSAALSISGDVPSTEEIIAAVDRLEESAIAMLSDLIAFDSTLGNEVKKFLMN